MTNSRSTQVGVLLALLVMFPIVRIYAAEAIHTEDRLINFSSSKVVLKKKAETFELLAEYPRFLGAKEISGRMARVNLEVKAFAYKLLATKWKNFVKGSSVLTEEDLESSLMSTVDLTYSVVHADSRYVSIKFTRYFYGQGAAHGVFDVFGLNYDVQHRRQIGLADLFDSGVDYVKQIVDYCDCDLIRQLGEGYWAKGNLTAADIARFAIDAKKLTIYFSDYQVACHAAGTPTVNIPLVKLTGLKKMFVRAR